MPPKFIQRKRRKARKAKRKQSTKVIEQVDYRQNSYRAGLGTSREPERVAVNRRDRLTQAVATAMAVKAVKPPQSVFDRLRDRKARFDTSKQSPNKPAYMVERKQSQPKAVRSSSFRERYSRLFRGRTRAECAERPDPSKAGEASVKARRERARYGMSGRIPYDIQKKKRGRKFRVWCE